MSETKRATAAIGAALRTIENTLPISGWIKGNTDSLKRVSAVAHDAVRTLEFVRGEPQLQTREVACQIENINKILSGLAEFFTLLLEQQGFGAVFNLGSRSGSMLESGNAADKALTGSLDDLQAASGELLVRNSIARVGVTGNPEDDFQADLKVPGDINTRVEKGLVITLVFAERLRGRTHDAETGIFLLEATDLEPMRPSDRPVPSSDGGAQAYKEWLASKEKSNNDLFGLQAMADPPSRSQLKNRSSLTNRGLTSRS